QAIIAFIMTTNISDLIEFGYQGHYGLEMIIDLAGCDLSDLSEEKLGKFFVELCDLIKMKRHGDPIFWIDHSDIPHLRGVSGIQFIETSNVVCHPLPMLKTVYLNIFSCKEFDTTAALEFCKAFWGAESEVHTVIPRG
ncbi:S-adenosylmethionine decarboxylase, partial [Candidatus Parcubacteria bacterium]|nr:S-adenosylmethionine decarboxylase [Candidatus Parcubacteria bacterium]